MKLIILEKQTFILLNNSCISLENYVNNYPIFQQVNLNNITYASLKNCLLQRSERVPSMFVSAWNNFKPLYLPILLNQNLTILMKTVFISNNLHVYFVCNKLQNQKSFICFRNNFCLEFNKIENYYLKIFRSIYKNPRYVHVNRVLLDISET